MNNLPDWYKKTALVLLVLAFPIAHAYAAASVSLSPPQNNAPQNTTFTLTLSINTDGNAVTGSDVTLQYAQSGLDFVSATNGNFFPNLVPANDPNTGQLVLHGYVTNISDAKTGTGTIATIVFTSKLNSGSSAIQFVCNGSGHDTNIVATTGQNILACGSVNSVGVSYAAVPAPTPTPGPPTSQSSNPPVCTNLVSDPSQVKGIPAKFLFSCSGTDNALILASTFDYGDGTSDTINQNVGSPGTISTQHSYTSTGTFRATCRVRDNDNLWSDITGACTKIISIIPNPVTQVVYRTVTSQGSTNQQLAAIPTPPEVSLVIPTIPAMPTAEPTVVPVESSKSGIPWIWIVAVLAIIVGAILALKGRQPPAP